MWPLDLELITKTSTVAACCSSLQVTIRVGDVLCTVFFLFFILLPQLRDYHSTLSLLASTRNYFLSSPSIPLSSQSPHLSWCIENMQIKYQPPFLNSDLPLPSSKTSPSFKSELLWLSLLPCLQCSRFLWSNSHSYSLIYLCFFPNSCLYPENPPSSPSKPILYFFVLLLITCLSIS